MRAPSLKVLALTVAALGLVGFAADRVIASTPTVKGKGKVFQVLNFQDQLGAGEFISDIAVIPDNQTLVVTDIILTNGSGDVGTFALLCNEAGVGNEILVGPITIADDGTFSHSFSTGVECHEGTTMRIQIAGASATNWVVTVSGFFRKGS
jgi:hypothetical protein